MFDTYDLSTLEGAAAFDRDLNGVSYTFGFGFDAISVKDAHANYYLTDRQMYFMAVDLKLNLFNLFSTIRELEMLKGRASLYEIFAFHNRWVHFVAVYRSFYDKFMNIIVKAGYPDKFSSFENSRSKLGKFKTIILQEDSVFLPHVKMFMKIPNEFVCWAHEFITLVNDQYRTSEVHGSGQARKWVFSERDLASTPYAQIKVFVEHMSQFLNILACIISGPTFAERLRTSSEKK